MVLIQVMMRVYWTSYTNGNMGYVAIRLLTAMNIAMMMVYWARPTYDNMDNDNNEHCFDDGVLGKTH